uniref:HhH-GPD domain-containing protein n=1 Tax=Daucus carota subsp. sativus TaxID=79200 RepID=A0A166JCV5_DAUCS
MEGEFGKEYILAPSISEKQNVMSQVLINARLEDKDLETRGVNVVQLDEESGAVVYGNQSSKFEFEATGVVSAKVQSGGTVNTLAMPVQHNDTSYHSSKEIDGVVLATSTPEKQESKKRPNSRIHLNKTPQKKLKNHKPKILESAKRKTHNDQASKFMPKTPLKRSTPIRRSKRSHGFVDVIDKFESPTIDHKYDQLVVRDRSVGASIVPYKGRFNPLKKKKKEALPKVDLDEKSEKAWLKLMDSCGKNYEQGEDEEYWDTERQIMINKVESVISILGGFQGNRSFSRWKGSVMDSIIGAYLTQNVSDHLSSSTFMCFAARFPPRDIKRSSKIHEKLSACLPLELFPKDVEMQKWGNKSTFQEISHIGSQSEIESLVNCASIIDREGTKVKSFQAKSEAKKEKIIGPIFSLSNGYNKRGFPDRKIKKNEKHKRDWDKLRKTYCQPRERNDDNMDAIDWESVRQAPIAEVVEIIQGRGMETVLANEIKACLDRVMRDHGSMDLEWLRDVPPKDAKEYLLSIYGIGLKSAECIRLLSLYHVAFPVDVNVGRVVVRLGWVPLQPLPEGLQLHLLQEYELHYHLITFGKLQVDKRDPNDPSPYLFAPWVFYEEGSKLRSSFSQGSSSSREIVCYPTFSNNEDDDFTTTVSGTLMIPVRSANKGSFALNGTYFQVNEVFADDESTNVPICVPKQWLSNLPSALLYCGANVTSAFRELPMECIHKAFSQDILGQQSLLLDLGSQSHLLEIYRSGGPAIYVPSHSSRMRSRVKEKDAHLPKKILLKIFQVLNGHVFTGLNKGQLLEKSYMLMLRLQPSFLLYSHKVYNQYK